MTVLISKPAINLREELASLRNQGGLPKEDKLYLDNLVDNGDFSNGTTGWDTSDGNITIVNGQLVINATPTDKSAYQQITLKPNTTYKVSIQLLTDGSYLYAYPQHNSNANNISGFPLKNTTSSGSVVNHSTILTTTGTGQLRLRLYTTNGDTGTFDNVSVQEVVENLVTNGTFDNGTTGWFTTGSGVGTWSVSSGGVSQSGQTAFSAYLNTPLHLVIGKTYTLSFDITQSGNGNANVGIGTNHSGVNTVNVWQDGDGVGSFSATFVATSSTHHVVIQEGTGTTATILDNFVVTEGTHQVIQSIPHGYDVKDVYIDGELAREGEAYDYQVQTDGINQWLKPTVEPTATTETVVIGVRK
jgi:hypothetical protein